MTLLHYASRSGQPDLVCLLIEQDVDPNADGPAGTPLTQACASAIGDERNLDVVRALVPLENSAEVLDLVVLLRVSAAVGILARCISLHDHEISTLAGGGAGPW
jgi:hypothetical protein